MSHAPRNKSYPIACADALGSASTGPGAHELEADMVARRMNPVGAVAVPVVSIESAPAEWTPAARYSVRIPDDSRLLRIATIGAQRGTLPGAVKVVMIEKVVVIPQQ